MEDIKNHDRYLDPPDYPTHSRCDWCHEIFDNGDLVLIGSNYRACKDCEEEAWEEKEEYDN